MHADFLLTWSHPGLHTVWAGAEVAPPDAQGASYFCESASRENNRSSNSGAATTDIQVYLQDFPRMPRRRAVVLETHVRITRLCCLSPVLIHVSLLIHVQRVH